MNRQTVVLITPTYFITGSVINVNVLGVFMHSPIHNGGQIFVDWSTIGNIPNSPSALKPIPEFAVWLKENRKKYTPSVYKELILNLISMGIDPSLFNK